MGEIRDYRIYVVEEAGGFTAHCPVLELSGCGPSAEEATASLRRHIEDFIAALKTQGRESAIPADNVVTTGSIGVAV